MPVAKHLLLIYIDLITQPAAISQSTPQRKESTLLYGPPYNSPYSPPRNKRILDDEEERNLPPRHVVEPLLVRVRQRLLRRDARPRVTYALPRPTHRARIYSGKAGVHKRAPQSAQECHAPAPRARACSCCLLCRRGSLLVFMWRGVRGSWRVVRGLWRGVRGVVCAAV